MAPLDLNLLEKKVAEKRAKLNATQEMLLEKKDLVVEVGPPHIFKPSETTVAVQIEEIDSCFASLDKILADDQGQDDKQKYSLYNLMYAIQHKK